MRGSKGAWIATRKPYPEDLTNLERHRGGVHQRHIAPQCTVEEMMRMQQNLMQTFTSSMTTVMQGMSQLQVQMASQPAAVQTGPNTNASIPPIPRSHDEDTSEKFAEDTCKELHAAKLKFEKKVRTYLKSKDNARVAKEEMDIMVNDTTMRRYPPGTPSCVYGRPEEEADIPLSKCSTENHELVIKIPRGTSRRTAIEMIHHQYVAQRKSIEAELLADRLTTTKAAATKESFFRKCEEIIESQYSTDMLTDMGIDPGTTKKPGQDFITAEVE